MKRKRYIAALLLIILIVLISVYKLYGIRAAGNSSLFYVNDKILYNNISEDICLYNTKENKFKVILKDKKLIYADKFYILCKGNNIIYIYNTSDSSLYMSIPDIDIVYGEIHKNILYFIDENGEFFKTELNNTIVITRYDNLQTKHFRIHNNTIYYENNNHIYSCNIYGDEQKEIYSGLYCYFFDVDDNCIYLSDYTQNGLIIAINIANGNVEKTHNVSATQFCVNDKRIYYIDYISETQYINRFLVRPRGAFIKVESK